MDIRMDLRSAWIGALLLGVTTLGLPAAPVDPAAPGGQRPSRLVERILDPATVFVGERVVGPAEVVLLRCSEGVLAVSRATLRGLDLIEAGGRAVPVQTREGLVWVAASMVRTGELLRDEHVIREGYQAVVDGVRFVAVTLEEGLVFLPEVLAEQARRLGRLTWRGIAWVARHLGERVVFLREDAEGLARRARRGLIAAELRTALSGVLGSGRGAQATRGLFLRRAQDGDPWVRAAAAAALGTLERMQLLQESLEATR